MLQWIYGLRPSEVLNLKGGHLLPASLYSPDGRTEPIVLLGLGRTTKAGRCQYVIAKSQYTPWANLITTAFKSTTSDAALLSNIHSVQAYNILIKRAAQKLGLAAAYSAHSPRAGWATTMRTLGMGFLELREMGRWTCDSSLRIYLDIVGAENLALVEASAVRWGRWLNEDLAHRYPWWA